MNFYRGCIMSRTIPRAYVTAAWPKNRVDAALRRLGKKERAFARAVLRGESWREMGLAKSTFSDRMKKVEKLLSRL